MRVAVTGASGFVGGQIARALDAMGHDVLSYGRRERTALRRPVPGYAEWDVTAGPIFGAGVDGVVHCAAHVGDRGSEAAYQSTNVDGTRAVLDSFPDADRFVYVSSASVYSDHASHDHIAEDAPIGACRYSAYSRTKAAAERLVSERRSDAVILRPHIVYGPDDTTLLPRLLAAKRFGRLPIPGNGRNRVSVTHVHNLALAVDLALQSPHATGPFNITDAEPAAVDELLRTVLRRVGATARIAYIPRAVAWHIAGALEGIWPTRIGPRGPLLTRYVVSQLADELTLDITRARAILGYEPRWTFRDGPIG
jgi:nucleoside-diphosphate-sugar epimerase